MQLKELLGEAEGHLKEGRKGWDAFVRVDEQIHMALAHISGNPLYIAVLTSVYHNIHTYYESYLPWKKVWVQENLTDLQDIIAAVSAGDAERAREIALEHVRRFNAHMEEKQE
jgi:DNA-binding GntR family transcriptional regulator